MIKGMFSWFLVGGIVAIAVKMVDGLFCILANFFQGYNTEK